MITPNNLKNINTMNIDYDAIENQIDNSIKRFHGSYSWETAIIDTELPVEVRNTIAQKYNEIGWTYVYHRTTSENGEKPGLTSFIFSDKPIEDKYLKNYTKYVPANNTNDDTVTLTASKKYVLPIANGQLELSIIPDNNYPGLDIEFTMSDESQNYITKPRILIEAPIDPETNLQENLRALIWAGAYSEDYTDKVVFTNRQLCKNKHTKLSFTDDIGYTEFEVYTEWFNAQKTHDASELFHIAAENPDVSGLIC